MMDSLYAASVRYNVQEVEVVIKNLKDSLARIEDSDRGYGKQYQELIYAYEEVREVWWCREEALKRDEEKVDE